MERPPRPPGPPSPPYCPECGPRPLWQGMHKPGCSRVKPPPPTPEERIAALESRLSSSSQEAARLREALIAVAIHGPDQFDHLYSPCWCDCYPHDPVCEQARAALKEGAPNER